MAFMELTVGARSPLGFLTAVFVNRTRPRLHSHLGVELLHPSVALGDSHTWNAESALQPARARAHVSRVLRPVHEPCAPPLRVLCQPQQNTGRLALSGRMADVCAELDRLVLQ